MFILPDSYEELKWQVKTMHGMDSFDKLSWFASEKVARVLGQSSKKQEVCAKVFQIQEINK